MAKLNTTQDVIKKLEAEGYEVKRKRDLVRKTFVIDREVLNSFMELVRSHDLLVQDAANMALMEWAASLTPAKRR